MAADCFCKGDGHWRSAHSNSFKALYDQHHMSERSYYLWIGRTMMTLSIMLPVVFTLLFLVITLDPDAYIGVTPRETVLVFLGIYAVSIGGLLIGRFLAKIPP